MGATSSKPVQRHHGLQGKTGEESETGTVNDESSNIWGGARSEKDLEEHPNFTNLKT